MFTGNILTCSCYLISAMGMRVNDHLKSEQF